MAYNLNYLSGPTLPVPDNGVASVGGITLPGKNYLGYGSIVDQDLLYIVENFATSPAIGPSLPIAGQVWYDYRNTTLKYNISTNVNSPTWVSLATLGGNIVADGIIANAITTGDIVADNGAIGNLTSGNITGGNIKGNIQGNLFYTVTFDNSGLGNASGNVYNGGSNKLISWNTIGAAKGNATGAASGLNVTSLADISLPGGTSGQFLTTDGTGSLSWTSPSAGSTIANGTSNVSIAASGNVTVGVAGNTGVLTITSTGINVAGTINGNITGNLINTVTFNDGGAGAASGAVYDATVARTVSWNTIGAAKGTASGAATAYSGPIANLGITGGAAGQFLTTDGAGVVGWSSTLPSPTIMTNITTGGAAIPGTITGAWTLTAGSKLEATYADLAERHHADAEYPVGTVMTVGGANEVTACPISVTPLGVVSDQYAYLMNSEAGPDETHPAVGYLGRVPVRVIGPITKHQRIAPAGGGVATAADKNSFGWALETNNEVGEKLVLCLIK